MEREIKGLDWIKPKSKKQADWIIEYATKRFPYVQLANSYPVSDEEKVLKIIEDLKQHYWREPDATAYQIGKMRNAWYKKEKRDRRTSSDKFLSIAINENTLKALNALAKSLKITQREAIEYLVNNHLNTGNLQISNMGVSSERHKNVELQKKLMVANSELNHLKSQLTELHQQNIQLTHDLQEELSKREVEVNHAPPDSSQVNELSHSIVHEMLSGQTELTQEDYEKSLKGEI
ncbi:hypothetical protein CGJ66_22535 [Vibrio parahaemolyticus]|uniref:hypothetical protein n=1 Tax=Vibrio parahaemolyticus TaxID=670 RepID=UPI0011206819|nr:hypothetical protein [Vibrio parahaemolyticus]TOD30831.1 hypothetical protein CGJ66_22535 [Vibrio parahaemolyticus]